MKKIIPIALAIILSFETDVYAQEKNTAHSKSNTYQTSGSYVGLDLIRAKSCFLVHNSAFGIPYSLPPHSCGASYGVGANYKYAFNYGGVFVAPGAFFEYDLSAPVKGRDEVNLDHKERYGVRVDVGYDLTSKFSPYVTGGYARVNYRVRSRGDGLTVDPSGPNGFQNLTTARDSGANTTFWGVGFKYEFTPTFSGNLEYQVQDYKAKAAIPTESSDYLSNMYFTTKLNILRAGVSYHF